MRDVLRSDLLEGVSVLLAQVPGACDVPALGDAVAGLGASVTAFAPELDEAGEGGAAWVRERGRFDALLVDARSGGAEEPGALGSAGDPGAPGGLEPLRGILDAAWIAVAAAVNGAFLTPGTAEADAGQAAGATRGRIVFVAPPRERTWWGPAAAAALENLARTLSVEWARHAITATVVVPSTATEPEAVATTVGFLLSPAGAYHSGSRLDLGLLAAAGPGR